MVINLSKRLVYACLLSAQLLTYSTAFARSGGGAIAGGGGDANEERVNVIRADLLRWINNNGARDLKLPKSTSYGEYFDKMTAVLEPLEVVVGFVEKDDETNEELMVSVDGTPKTCRGFISIIDSKKHILCNISRFKNTSEPEQYKLIHHEYAGLVNIENNEAAASDYAVSSQITEFLSYQTVLRLAVKSKRNKNVLPTFVKSKETDLGNSRTEVGYTLKNTEGVLKVTLFDSSEDKLQPIILDEDNDFTFSKVLDWHGSKRSDFHLKYTTAFVQFEDGEVMNIEGVTSQAQNQTMNKNVENISSEDVKDVMSYKKLSSRVITYPDTEATTIVVKYQINYDTTHIDLSKYKGVYVHSGRPYEKSFDDEKVIEFMSEDPAELEKFIKSQNRTYEVAYHNDYKITTRLCNILLFGCLWHSSKVLPTRTASSAYNETKLFIKFITKDDNTEYKINVLQLPEKM